ncbi:hypothetical protein [Vibrio vulnificus]|uniref:hypothetical protein n=2 Tax=Vibrio TaxID=662 RepID=UPI0010293B31|nr:hypothetical protein [Vibrio vulnificus]EGQ9118386.1 hypothetical protein [Vibrio parahaemolyticus]EGQ9522635.1 hypothetical protein [Vibrio parahaemolyticus]EHH2421855.1 hypothetical protein [Vibrio parahaemolyticus]EJV0279302.1 hypothetical protein [Vibrio parahaemolyticus]EKM6954056.1 hypothetical protein [Vibrio parahaemolyticus]
MKAHGEFPDVVYRAFDKREYAEAFIAGNVRFANCNNYLDITDSRRDVTEGTGLYLKDDRLTTIRFCSNSIFIQSFHRTFESARNAGHGRYIIELHNPFNLATAITKELHDSSFKAYGGVEGVNIIYQHGDFKGEQLSSYQSSRFTYSQKPSSYSSEEEFRFVLITERLDKHQIFIQVNPNEECKFIRHYA